MKVAVLFALGLLSGPAVFAQTPVDVEDTLMIGGIQQYVTMRGRDSSLPLLLFLHGGPGGSVMGYSEKFTDKLEAHFVVVQWDQRETGRTLALNASPLPLTVSLFQEDTRELIDSLLKRFQRQKIYLAAHSWGTVLGFHMARVCPDILYAYMPIGPMINQLESEQIALSMMMKKAREKGDEAGMKELATVRIPFESGAQLYVHRKWLLDLAGGRRRLSRKYVEDWAARWLGVFNDASKENLIDTLPSVDCPVYFFAGRRDYQTNAAIAEQYYTILKAPKKEFFWFESSAHAIPTSDPERLQRLIIEKVLPETFTIQKAAALIGDR